RERERNERVRWGAGGRFEYGRVANRDEQNERRPERGDGVEEDANREMRSRRDREPRGKKEPYVLQIPAAPAQIALARDLERRGALFVAACGDVPGETYLVARAAHQGRFDEIVAQDRAAERRPAGEAR